MILIDSEQVVQVRRGASNELDRMRSALLAALIFFRLGNQTTLSFIQRPCISNARLQTFALSGSTAFKGCLEDLRVHAREKDWRQVLRIFKKFEARYPRSKLRYSNRAPYALAAQQAIHACEKLG